MFLQHERCANVLSGAKIWCTHICLAMLCIDGYSWSNTNSSCHVVRSTRITWPPSGALTRSAFTLAQEVPGSWTLYAQLPASFVGTGPGTHIHTPFTYHWMFLFLIHNILCHTQYLYFMYLNICFLCLICRMMSQYGHASKNISCWRKPVLM